MAANNGTLSNAKKAKNDEFYTQLKDIEDELRNYKPYFKGKTVYLNCDDHERSNFWKYFELNFTHLGLKKLIATHYDPDKPTYKIEMESGVNNGIVKTLLVGNGDFRSAESVELLKEADIVVSNPPFSFFREYVAQLYQYDKKFLILGNNNAITYKEIFPLIRDNKLWLGYGVNKSMEFSLPASYTKFSRVDKDGTKYGIVPAITWFTNLPVDKRSLPLILLPQQKTLMGYDNYCAVNVDKVKDIPDNEWVEVEISSDKLQAWKDLYGEENIEVIEEDVVDESKS